jgi:3-oxo-5-alpha-steroid 4-dehydrogenase 1
MLICWQLTILQWAVSWYGMGKTSSESRFNIPGKIAWLTMEMPGFLTLLYIMYSLPDQVGLSALPWENKAMGALFVRPIPTQVKTKYTFTNTANR